jgi:hypothetical protein
VEWSEDRRRPYHLRLNGSRHLLLMLLMVMVMVVMLVMLVMATGSREEECA